MMNKKTGLVALLAGIATGASATTLTNYTTGDVLVCFRNGANDMVVDAGPISTFTSASPNQVIPVNQYTGDQLAVVGTNGTSWSAFTYLSDNTLFVTRPRITPGTQTTPWAAKNSSTQHNSALRMATIPPGATDEYIRNVISPSTQISVLEEDVSAGNPNYVTGLSYHDALAGAYGSDFNGTFVGDPENTTANSDDPTQAFTGLGQVQRSDFYQMSPTGGFGSANGKFLGYFELNTNGVLNYVAFPSVLPAIPVITSIERTNNTTTINYTTGLSGTFTLRATNTLTSGVSMVNWPAVSVLSTGDILSHQVQFTDTNNAEFYIITAQ